MPKSNTPKTRSKTPTPHSSTPKKLSSSPAKSNNPTPKKPPITEETFLKILNVPHETSPQNQNFGNVPHETLEHFRAWKGLLEKWNGRINLVSPAAMMDFWGRHALDSQQLVRFLPNNAETILDLGSGAGFPGLALAIACKGRGRGQVTLVESAGKKANFLRAVIRELALPATVWADRAEKMPPKPFDVISARAFAPLPSLLAYAHPFWGENTIALLLKGQNANKELTLASKSWSYDVESIASLSDESGLVLILKDLQARS